MPWTIDHGLLTELFTMLIPGIELSGKPLRDYISGLKVDLGVH
jgi:hypothetical protein